MSNSSQEVQTISGKLVGGGLAALRAPDTKKTQLTILLALRVRVSDAGFLWAIADLGQSVSVRESEECGLGTGKRPSPPKLLSTGGRLDLERHL
jgi:hypothetical protein